MWPRGRVQFDYRGIIWTILVEDTEMMLYTNCESSGPCSFRQEYCWKFYFENLFLSLYSLPYTTTSSTPRDHTDSHYKYHHYGVNFKTSIWIARHVVQVWHYWEWHPPFSSQYSGGGVDGTQYAKGRYAVCRNSVISYADNKFYFQKVEFSSRNKLNEVKNSFFLVFASLALKSLDISSSFRGLNMNWGNRNTENIKQTQQN